MSRVGSLLPDFIDIKKRITRRSDGSIYQAVTSDQLLSGVRHYRVHEGNRFTIARADGTRHTSLYEEKSFKGSVSRKDIEAKGFSAVEEALAQVRDKMLDEMRKEMIDTIGEATREAGTAIDAKGQRFIAEMYLDMLGRVTFDFDDHGKPILPTLQIPPALEDRVKAELARIDSEPSLKVRFEEIIRKKRQEWDDREANRKLVD